MRSSLFASRTEEWPRRSDTVTKSMPSASRNDPWPFCLTRWMVRRDSPTGVDGRRPPTRSLEFALSRRPEGKEQATDNSDLRHSISFDHLDPDPAISVAISNAMPPPRGSRSRIASRFR